MKRFTLYILTLLLIGAAPAQPLPQACTAAHAKLLSLDSLPVGTPTEYCPWLKGYGLLLHSLAYGQPPNADSISVLIDEQSAMNLDKQNKALCLSDLYIIRSLANISNKAYLQAAISYLSAMCTAGDCNGWMANRWQMLNCVMCAQIHNNVPLIYNSSAIGSQIDKFTSIVDKLLTDSTMPKSFTDETKLLSALLLPLVGDDGSRSVQMCTSYGKEWATNSPLAAYVTAMTYIKNGHSAQALQILTTADSAGFCIKMNKLNLQLGNLLLNQQNDSCQIFLNRYIEYQTNGADVPYAQMKLAWLAFLSGDSASVRQLCACVMSAKPLTPNDEQARYECGLVAEWNITLLRARLLFDNGDYEKCISVLKSIDSEELTSIQQSEYFYRLGRAYQKTGNLTLAATHLQSAINNKVSTEVYYPSYAAYYLGVVHKKLGHQEQAHRYFSICQQTDSPICRELIHRRAKMADN